MFCKEITKVKIYQAMVWLMTGCIFSNTALATDINAGNVSGVWSPAGNPYLINGEIRVAPGETLSIEPGTQIHFTGPYNLKILGNFSAVGLPGDSIVFTTSAAGITWRGIRLDSLSSQSDTARFSHCLMTRMYNTSIRIINTSKVAIEDSRIFQNTQLYAGTIYMVNSSARISRNVIHNNSGASGTWTAGIYLSDGAPLISGNTFRSNFAPNSDSSLSLWREDYPTSPMVYGNVFENHTNGFITLHNFVTPTFDSNVFSNNQGSLTGTCIWINAAYAGYINFRNNVFYNNSGGDDGGCIKVNQSLVNFENNIFESNETTFSGGAIQITNESTVNITDCEFKYNHVGNGGSAVYVEDYSYLTMNRCFIHNNTSQGGAFYVGSHSEASITNCVFANNEASNVAGAAYIHQHSAPVFSNCLFANNKAANGGALYLYWEGDPVLNNCIFWGNEDQNGINNIAVQDYIWNYCNPSFSHCVVQNGQQSFVMGTSTVALYEAVIESDPMFVESTAAAGVAFDAAEANWKVWADTSPCIDAGMGDPLTLELGDFDLAGNNRLSGGALDIGPYEGGFGYFICDMNLDGIVTMDDMTIFLGSFGCSNANCEPADIDNDGEVGISDMMIFIAEYE